MIDASCTVDLLIFSCA